MQLNRPPPKPFRVYSRFQSLKRQVNDIQDDVVENEFLKTIDPTSDDDETKGYSIGSRWVDIVTKTEYVCTDVTEGSAVWTANPLGGDFVTEDGVETLTNKTITDESNLITATGLRTSDSKEVVISSSSPPSTGQVLTATSSTEAKWQDPAVTLDGTETLTNKTIIGPSNTISATGLRTSGDDVDIKNSSQP